MKILVIINAHFGTDGISNVAKNYYLYQNHSRVRMDLLTINEIPGELEEEMERNGDNCYVLNKRNSNPFAYLTELIRIIKTNRYDIVHTHGNSNTICIELLAAKLGGCKVRIAHSHNTRCDHPIINALLRPAFKMTYTDGFACGKEAGRWLFKKDEFTVVANGVDLQRYSLDVNFRSRYRKDLGLEGRMVIGHVGRFSLQKNHKKLLSIYAAIKKQNPNASLLMWGEGELIDNIQAQAMEIGGDIRFMGISNQIERCLHALDIIIFPSLYEGLPLSLVEAQAMGLPCLLSDTISPMTKITDWVKFIPLTSDDETWANEALHLIETSNMIFNARKAHQQIRNAGYDIRENAGKLLSKYKQLIHKNNG